MTTNAVFWIVALYTVVASLQGWLYAGLARRVKKLEDAEPPARPRPPNGSSSSRNERFMARMGSMN